MPTYRIQLRRGTGSEWSAQNPTLALGELGYETDTGNVKIGDGASSWNSLNRYFGIQGSVGAQGAQGTQGRLGAQGTQGLQGTQGILGAQGSQGPLGVGAQGAAGSAQGAIGTQGLQGSTGAGTQGVQGLQGVGGISGSRTYSVTNSGSSSYIIDGSNNPTLNLLRGFTYIFNVNASGHPFWIKTAQVTGTGSAYSSGVTNNGIDSGTITFAVPYDAPDTLYYICQFHGSMVGTISITNVGPQGATGTQGTLGTQGIQGSSGGGGATVTVSDTAPVGAANGDLWFDSSSATLRIYYGDGNTQQWVDSVVTIVGAQGVSGSGGVTAVNISDTAPVGAANGDLWFDSSSATLRIYYGDGNTQQWVDSVVTTVGAQGATGSGAQGAIGVQGSTGAAASGDFLSLTQTTPRQQVNSQVWFSSTDHPTITDGTDLVTEYPVGYLHLPVDTKSSNSTLTRQSAGKLLYFTSGNVFIANDADPVISSMTVGSSIGVFNNAASLMYITPNTSVTLRLIGSSSSGTRSLSSNGMVSLIKVASNNWLISGSGISCHLQYIYKSFNLYRLE